MAHVFKSGFAKFQVQTVQEMHFPQASGRRIKDKVLPAGTVLYALCQPDGVWVVSEKECTTSVIPFGVNVYPVKNDPRWQFEDKRYLFSFDDFKIVSQPKPRF